MLTEVETTDAKEHHEADTYQPRIKSISINGLGHEVQIPEGAIVFVVGPNNGGKSTFLREISLSTSSNRPELKWISETAWELGTKEEWAGFIKPLFIIDPENHGALRDIASNMQVHPSHLESFYSAQRIPYVGFLIRSLNAEGRIHLANQTSSPDVIQKRRVHPYHAFFYEIDLEAEFSERIKSAFGYEFRINRTGSALHGHLGPSPAGARLSEAYEISILEKMETIDRFGDGVRSYTGILLNSIADPRPVTVIDEPEAFLHPPQARRLGQEIASASHQQKRQAFVATHSSDFIQGALLAKNPNTIFLYLNHSQTERKAFLVDRAVVDEFSKKPLLQYTNALDALFYEQAIICEGEADIMFFRWALEGSPIGKPLQESFWISSYGKSAIPKMMEDMLSLGIPTRAVFDLDVLLSPDILIKVCKLIGVDFSKYQTTFQDLSNRIKVPPSAEALTKIEEIVKSLPSDEDEPGRHSAIRAIKRTAEGLGKSWALKSNGLRAIGRGEVYGRVEAFIKEMRERGVVILEEGEIENYAPAIGKHGQAYVRQALDDGPLSEAATRSLRRQFSALAGGAR